jgi:hypothetical protein
MVGFPGQKVWDIMKSRFETWVIKQLYITTKCECDFSHTIGHSSSHMCAVTFVICPLHHNMQYVMFIGGIYYINIII